MKPCHRVIRPAIGAIGLCEIAERRCQKRLFLFRGCGVPETVIGGAEGCGKIGIDPAKPAHQPRHRRQGDKAFQLGEFLLQILRHTLDQEIAK